MKKIIANNLSRKKKKRRYIKLPEALQVAGSFNRPGLTFNKPDLKIKVPPFKVAPIKVAGDQVRLKEIRLKTLREMNSIQTGDKERNFQQTKIAKTKTKKKVSFGPVTTHIFEPSNNLNLNLNTSGIKRNSTPITPRSSQ